MILKKASIMRLLFFIISISFFTLTNLKADEIMLCKSSKNQNDKIIFKYENNIFKGDKIYQKTLNGSYVQLCPCNKKKVVNKTLTCRQENVKPCLSSYKPTKEDPFVGAIVLGNEGTIFRSVDFESKYVQFWTYTERDKINIFKTFECKKTE